MGLVCKGCLWHSSISIFVIMIPDSLQIWMTFSSIFLSRTSFEISDIQSCCDVHYLPFKVTILFSKILFAIFTTTSFMLILSLVFMGLLTLSGSFEILLHKLWIYLSTTTFSFIILIGLFLKPKHQWHQKRNQINKQNRFQSLQWLITECSRKEEKIQF